MLTTPQQFAEHIADIRERLDAVEIYLAKTSATMADLQRHLESALEEVASNQANDKGE
jgi:hypothetical protein